MRRTISRHPQSGQRSSSSHAIQKRCVRRCKLEAPKSVPLTYLLDPDVAWWPKVLQGNLDGTRIRDSGLTVYSFTEALAPAVTARIMYFVDWQNGRAYFFTKD
jgi:hypothetical protein